MLYKTNKYIISHLHLAYSCMALILMLMKAQRAESRLVWIPRMENMNDDSAENHDNAFPTSDKTVINNRHKNMQYKLVIHITGYL